MKCPKCGAFLQPTQTQCLKCGARFKSQKCASCGASFMTNLSECPHCGRKIKAAASSDKTMPPQSGGKTPLTKRWWFWAACAFLVIGIIGNIGNAVNGKDSGPKNRISSSTATPTAEPVINNPFLAAEVHEKDVMNGIKTDKIGTWAYIEIDKATAKASSQEDYSEFAKSKVSGSGYNWFSIIFEDGTGITFTGCYTYLSTYGTQDDEGCIVDAMGDISLNTDTGLCSYTKRAEPTAVPTAEPSVSPTKEPAPTPAQRPAGSGISNESAANIQEVSPTKAPAQVPNDNVKPPNDNSSTQNGASEQDSPKAPESSTIYVTATGDRYHYDNNCNGGTYYPSTLEEAKKRGLTPCKKCVQ